MHRAEAAPAGAFDEAGNLNGNLNGNLKAGQYDRPW
jgi:hypothetical protein